MKKPVIFFCLISLSILLLTPKPDPSFLWSRTMPELTKLGSGNYARPKHPWV